MKMLGYTTTSEIIGQRATDVIYSEHNNPLQLVEMQHKLSVGQVTWCVELFKFIHCVIHKQSAANCWRHSFSCSAQFLEIFVVLYIITNTQIFT